MDGRVPPTAREITTGQTNRVWHVASPTPYVLKHYGDGARAANEAAALGLLADRDMAAPRLIAFNAESTVPWTAQSYIRADPVPTEQLLPAFGEALTAVHRIPGPHAGRIAGSTTYPSWPAYLRDRLSHYAAAAPHLASIAMELENEVEQEGACLDIQPRFLHHDLQPGHLLRHLPGRDVLIDWELAAFGDPLSDFARLAVRLRMDDPTPAFRISRESAAHAETRFRLYWRIHQLAEASLGSTKLV